MLKWGQLCHKYIIWFDLVLYKSITYLRVWAYQNIIMNFLKLAIFSILVQTNVALKNRSRRGIGRWVLETLAFLANEDILPQGRHSHRKHYIWDISEISIEINFQLTCSWIFDKNLRRAKRSNAETSRIFVIFSSEEKITRWILFGFNGPKTKHVVISYQVLYYK